MRRPHVILCTFCILVWALASSELFADDYQTLTNDSILQLVAWRVSNNEIVKIIGLDTNRCSFDVSPQAVTTLKTRSVPGDVIDAMQLCAKAASKKPLTNLPSSTAGSYANNQPQVGAMTDAVQDRLKGANTSKSAEKLVGNAGTTLQDRIVLRNGSAIKGQVLYVQCAPGSSKPLPSSIQFQMSDISTKTGISFNKVQSLLLSNDATKLTIDGTVAPSPAIADYLATGPSNRKALPASAPELSLSSALTEACNATDHYWNGDITLTGAYGIGTQTQKQIGGGLGTSFVRRPQVYTWNYQIARLDLEAKYTVAAKVGSPALKTQEIYYGDFVYSFYPSSRWSPYGIARLYHNYSLGLGLSQIYGGGIAYSLRGLVLSGGVVGITERLYAPSVPFSSAGARLYEAYSTVLGATKITFFESVDVFPSFQLSKAIQGRGVAGFVIPAWSRLQFIPKFGDDYLGNAPPKHRLNYSNTSVSLDLKIGRTQ